MTLNLSKLQQVLPDTDTPGRTSGSYYPINDDIFGLTEQQKELRALVYSFAKNELQKEEGADKAADKNEQEDLKTRIDKDRKLWITFGKFGLLGITVKEDYGGIGGSHMDFVIIQEELSRLSISLARSYCNHPIHCVHPINRYGTEEQKRKYLPKLCSGEHIGTGTISIDNTGATALRAEKQGNYYILNGISLASNIASDIIISYAITNSNISSGITAFIVENCFEIEGCLSTDTTPGSFTFKNCKVPAKNVLGEKNNGMEILLSVLNLDNLIWAAGPVGLMQILYDLVFISIDPKEIVKLKEKIARMYANLTASRNYVYTIARAYDNGKIDYDKDCAAVLIFCGKNIKKFTVVAEEILGKSDFLNDPTKKLLVEMKSNKFGTGPMKARRHKVGTIIRVEYSL